MNVRANFPLALSAAFFAIVLEKSSDAEFWAKHETLSASIGFSMIACLIVGGWMLLTEEISRTKLAGVVWCGTLLFSSMTIYHFLATFSRSLAMAYGWGMWVIFALLGIVEFYHKRSNASGGSKVVEGEPSA